MRPPDTGQNFPACGNKDTARLFYSWVLGLHFANSASYVPPIISATVRCKSGFPSSTLPNFLRTGKQRRVKVLCPVDTYDWSGSTCMYY